MIRKEFVLAVLSVAGGQEHTPVQVQKLFFLMDQEISDLVDGPYFNFGAYNYGPFDKSVYSELENLAKDELARIVPKHTWNNYMLSGKGQELGSAKLQSLPEDAQGYIRKASEFVRSLSFTQLITAIYKAYPEMRENSVFQG